MSTSKDTLILFNEDGNWYIWKDAATKIFQPPIEPKERERSGMLVKLGNYEDVKE